MPTDLDFQWFTTPMLDVPDTFLGGLYFVVWLLVFGVILWFGQDTYLKASGRQWGLTVLFMLLAVAEVIPRFELSGGTFLPPVSQAGGATIVYRPLGFTSVALAAWYLNPMLALMVGMAEGLSRALWGSHQLSEIFHYGFIGWGVSLLVQQKIKSRRWAVLRTPPIASTLGQLLVGWPFVFLATFFLVPAGSAFLPTLDLALSTAQSQWPVALLEGLISGAVVWLGQRLIQRKIESGLTIPPFEQDMRFQQPLQFLFYSLTLLVLLGTAVSIVGYDSARTLIQTQVAHQANEVSRTIPPFISTRQSVLLEWGDDPRLHGSDSARQQESLNELFYAGTFFRRLILVDGSGQILASVPAGEPVSLSEAEEQALKKVGQLDSPDQALSKELDEHRVVLSLITPAKAPQAAETNVSNVSANKGETLFLIGRIPDQILSELVRGLTVGTGGTGYIIGENQLILAHSNGTEWPDFENELPSGGIVLPAPSNLDTKGVFTVRPDVTTNERELEYRTSPGDGHPWTVVVEVPMAIVLQQTFRLVARIFLIILGMTVPFAFFLMTQSSTIAYRLKNLVAAVEHIPVREPGQVLVPLNVMGDDEVGRLGAAFHKMQMNLDQQMGELNLLLNVSQGVAQVQQQIKPGINRILEQIIDGTDAAGARIVVTVLGEPIRLGNGETEQAMAPFDLEIESLLTNNQDLVLTSSEALHRVFGFAADKEPPFQSAIAYPLRGSNQAEYGYMWLTWLKPHVFRESERSLIRSLSEQTSVMVQNWYFYLNLDRRRRELKAVLDATVDPVIVIDANKKISMVNPAAYKQLGISERMRHVPASHLIPQPELVEILTAPYEKGTMIEEITLDNGKTFNVTVSVILAQSGKIAGRVAVLRDVSKMKEISEMKSDFVRLASHDLKDPITIVNGYIQMLPLTGPLNDKQKDQVDRIQGAMNSMQKLVEDLLNITRLEAGLALERMPVSIPDIFASVVHTFEPMAQSVGNRLIIELADRIPLLSLNPTFAQQAISNLISNALKYAPNSGDVLIKAEVMGEEIVISVTDRGVGIPAAIQGRLFEKFFRFSQPGQARSKSHGLGLSFVTLVAERHNGRAWFESVEGEGSVFYLSFPNEPASY
ncbi:MAG: PAS domain S-box-containing protein [Cellvibrionaceae bacterium]|jgi:PAS domain S-box-containing protein